MSTPYKAPSHRYVVSEIQLLEPCLYSLDLDVATVEDRVCRVPRGSFHSHDLVIYVPPGTCIPDQDMDLYPEGHAIYDDDIGAVVTTKPFLVPAKHDWALGSDVGSLLGFSLVEKLIDYLHYSHASLFGPSYMDDAIVGSIEKIIPNGDEFGDFAPRPIVVAVYDVARIVVFRRTYEEDTPQEAENWIQELIGALGTMGIKAPYLVDSRLGPEFGTLSINFGDQLYRVIA